MNSYAKLPKILVVDDDEIIGRLFCSFLESNGISAIAANSLQSAKSVLGSDEKIDLMVLDYELGDGVGMDLLNGNDSISAICKTIPIIMVSANEEPSFLQECFSGGIDDYIIKPVNLSLLALKIEALISSVNMQRVIAEQKNELEIFKLNAEREEKIAKFTYEYLLKQYAKPQDGIDIWLRSFSAFSGDIVLMQKSPNGSLNFMLADATGHGLAAAITILPVANIFNSMVAKGFHVQQIVTEINRKLVNDTPEDRFVAAVVMEINPIRHEIAIWNGGMPSVCWVKGGEITRQFNSMHMALGILDEMLFDANVATFDFPEDGFLFVCSDGLLEQQNKQNMPFGMSGVKDVIRRRPAKLLNELESVLQNYASTNVYSDDISACTIDMSRIFSEMTYPSDVMNESISATQSSPFSLQIHLSGKKLENCDIPPLCNHFLQQLGFEQPSCQKIFSIIAEMVSNSIDHGVLQLSSEIKETPDGFVHYFSERDRRLRNLKDSDFINVNLYWNTDEAPNRLTIEVEDSGMGYSAENTIGGTVKNYSGRGLELIRRMSESIEVFPPGNKIRVIVK